MQTGLRVAFRLMLGLTVLLVLAQAYHLLAWLVTGNGRCDFPEDCLGTAYPQAFDRAARLWTSSLVAGSLTCCLALARRAHPGSVARLAIACLVAGVAYRLTPWARYDDPAKWMTFADPSGENAFGGVAWWALVLLAVSLLIYGWDVVRRLYALEAENEARDDARRVAGSVTSAAG